MRLVTILAIAGSFTAGYCLGPNSHEPSPDNKKVNSIGGVFFKSKDPVALKAWYQQHLGMKMESYGTNFEWRQAGDSTKKGFTLWAPFKETTGILPRQRNSL